MSFPGIAVGALDAAANLALSASVAGRGACAMHPAADRFDSQAEQAYSFCNDRPTMAARGIVIGILLSVPLWTLFAAAAYLFI